MTEFGPHVVALIDFLGHAGELAKWDFVPGTVTEMAEWVPAVRNSMGRVLRWREEFEGVFYRNKAESDRYMEQASVGQPAERRRQFDEYRKTSLLAAHFSDTLIFYSPLQNEHGYWQTSNIAKMIGTCGVLMLVALATKTVFRGAIEVGMLCRFPTGDPYGPALAKAHHLEAKVADYPRIIVGPGLLSYLDTTLKNTDMGWPAKANRAVATACQRLITQDTDGCWIVDYLSDQFVFDAAIREASQQVRSKAYAFIQAELERFKKEGNDKLVKRYERLLAYFRSRGVS